MSEETLTTPSGEIYIRATDFPPLPRGFQIVLQLEDLHYEVSADPDYPNELVASGLCPALCGKATIGDVKIGIVGLELKAPFVTRELAVAVHPFEAGKEEFVGSKNWRKNYASGWPADCTMHPPIEDWRSRADRHTGRSWFLDCQIPDPVFQGILTSYRTGLIHLVIVVRLDIWQPQSDENWPDHDRLFLKADGGSKPIEKQSARGTGVVTSVSWRETIVYASRHKKF